MMTSQPNLHDWASQRDTIAQLQARFSKANIQKSSLTILRPINGIQLTNKPYAISKRFDLSLT